MQHMESLRSEPGTWDVRTQDGTEQGRKDHRIASGIEDGMEQQV
jgi:hypothetical protein